MALQARRNPRDVDAEVNAIMADISNPEAFGAFFADPEEPLGLEEYGDEFGDVDLIECGAKLRLCGGVAFLGFHEE